jgi:hypothetical protein
MDEHDPKYCDPGRTKDSRRTSPDSVLDGPERKEKSIHYCYGEEIRGHYVFCQKYLTRLKGLIWNGIGETLQMATPSVSVVQQGVPTFNPRKTINILQGLEKSGVTS